MPLCIIGLNESGKTTILQGIELIGALCEGKELRKGDFNAIKPRGPQFNDEIKFGVMMEVEASDKKEFNWRDKKDIKTIGLTFSYKFKLSEYQEGEDKITGYINGQEAKKERKQKLIEHIKECAPPFYIMTT